MERDELRIGVGRMAQKGDTKAFPTIAVRQAGSVRSGVSTRRSHGAGSAPVCGSHQNDPSHKAYSEESMSEPVLTPPAGPPRRFSTYAAGVSGQGDLSLSGGRRIRSTTVICVRRGTSVVMAADGQVTLGDSVIKHTAKKIRRLYQDKILAGFAGSTADAFSLFSRFEGKLEQYAGNLGRSAVELAKDWRTDKMLRKLEALLVVADLHQTFLISGIGRRDRAGRGDCDDRVAAARFALAAARALIQNTELSARDIAEKSLRIAGQICIYTNDQITIEEL